MKVSFCWPLITSLGCRCFKKSVGGHFRRRCNEDASRWSWKLVGKLRGQAQSGAALRGAAREAGPRQSLSVLRARMWTRMIDDGARRRSSKSARASRDGERTENGFEGSLSHLRRIETNDFPLLLLVVQHCFFFFCRLSVVLVL